MQILDPIGYFKRQLLVYKNLTKTQWKDFFINIFIALFIYLFIYVFSYYIFNLNIEFIFILLIIQIFNWSQSGCDSLKHITLSVFIVLLIMLIRSIYLKGLILTNLKYVFGILSVVLVYLYLRLKKSPNDLFYEKLETNLLKLDSERKELYKVLIKEQNRLDCLILQKEKFRKENKELYTWLEQEIEKSKQKEQQFEHELTDKDEEIVIYKHKLIQIKHQIETIKETNGVYRLFKCMSNRLVPTKSFLEDLFSLSQKKANKCIDKLNKIDKYFREQHNIKKYKNTDNLYRLRAGELRIVFQLKGIKDKLVLKMVGYKKEIEKRLKL